MIHATQRRVIWIDVDLRKNPASRKAPSKKAELEMLVLWRAFLQWTLDENVMPVAKGHQGPLGFSNGYTPHFAKKVIAWLKSNGVTAESQYGRPKYPRSRRKTA